MLRRGKGIFMIFMFSLVLIALLPASNWAQSLNATLTGTVADPSGAIIAGVELTLTSVATGTVLPSDAEAVGS